MRTQIAVGVIYNKQGDKVLLALRPDNVSQGGLWEFPGGKIIPGEDLTRALVRELYEELGLRVISAGPLITIDHDYPDLSVTLHVMEVTNWSGTVSGREGQYIEWVSLDGLMEKNLPEANRAIAAAARLPPLYLVTPDLPVYDQGFLDDLAEILRAGVRLLQFRCKHPRIQDNPEAIRNILEICNQYRCTLLVNGVPADVIRHRSHGVHLTSKLLLSLDNRPLPNDKWVAASCHNQEELDHACRIGVDFAVLAPVQVTASHPGAEPMGWKTFAGLARCSTIPVYALGGMNIGDPWKARDKGGQGAAMVSAIWDAPDKADAVRRILDKKV